MKTLDFNKTLRDFQYKPNFGYGAYERNGMWWIRVIMLVENAREPFRKWELGTVPERIQFGRDWYELPPSRGVGFSPSREMIEVVGNYVIPPFVEGEEDTFVSWMVATIRAMEDHETFEWLRYKGELINDPHKERL